MKKFYFANVSQKTYKKRTLICGIYDSQRTYTENTAVTMIIVTAVFLGSSHSF